MSIAAFPGLRSSGLDTDQIGQTVPNVLKMAAAGRNFANEDAQNYLKFQVGGQMAAGNTAEASQAAFSGGDIKTGMDISNWDVDRRTKALALINDGAQRADTPARWSQLVSTVEGMFGPQMVAQYRDFASRPKAMTVLQEAQLNIQKQSQARQNEAAQRAAELHVPQLALARTQAANAGQPEIVRLMKAAGMDETSPESREIIRQSIKGESPIDQAITGMLKQAMPQPPAAPPRPGVKPMSYEGDPGQDPNLIRTQAAAPASPQGADAGSMFSGMPADQRRRLGEALLLSPKTKALGEQMMKDIDRERQDLGKTAINDLDEKIVTGLDQISRLEAMNRSFEDKYQTIGTRLKMMGTSWMAKIDPQKVSPEDAKELADFSKDRRRAIENLNMTIKDITGAAMSLPEADRIKSQVPDPGVGIFDGHDPIRYRANMQGALDDTRLAVARRAWLKKNNPQLLEQLAARKMEGVETVMPLDRMRDTMNQRKNEIYQGLKKQYPGASREQLIPYVGQMLNQEFGI